MEFVLELAKGKLEEAKKLYEKAIQVASRDGRAYLGLSKVAQRRRDFKYAKDYPKTGIANGFGDGTLVTRKLRQGPNAGKRSYHTAEGEFKKVGLKPSNHVYTAWEALEWKAGDIQRGRELSRMALEIFVESIWSYGKSAG
eukprot:scaffold855_cov274-Chaetoceros_neogracile.AAC.12